MANVTGLQPGTGYTFTVSSESADGQTSPLSEIIVASTLIQGTVWFFFPKHYLCHFRTVQNIGLLTLFSLYYKLALICEV